jgi:hypothetical protein
VTKSCAWSASTRRELAPDPFKHLPLAVLAAVERLKGLDGVGAKLMIEPVLAGVEAEELVEDVGVSCPTD